MRIRKFGVATALLTVSLVSVAVPARAETVAELDALSKATDQPATGIALARKQADEGELLDALATLERVIINHPASDEARLFHANLVCQMDDTHGAIIEFDGLQGHDLDADKMDEAKAPCTSGGRN